MPQHHPLYQRMRAAGVTLQKIADLTGRTRSAIQKQLNRDEEPDDYVREAIEKALAERGEWRDTPDRGDRAWIAAPSTTVDNLRRQVMQQMRSAYETRNLMIQYGAQTVNDLLDVLREQQSRLLAVSTGTAGPGSTARPREETAAPAEQPKRADTAYEGGAGSDEDEDDGEPGNPEDFEFEE